MSPVAINAAKFNHRSRTRIGIREARKNGVHWGAHGTVLAQQNKNRAEAFAEEICPVLFEICTLNGMLGPGERINAQKIADKLNARGCTTANGSLWHPTTVRRVIQRLGSEFFDKAIAARKAQNLAELKLILPPGDPLWAPLAKHVAKS